MEPTGTNGRTRHTFQPLFGGLGLVLWWFSRWMARNAVSCGRNDDTGKAFDLLASVVRFPDRHDRNRSRGWFRCRPIRVVGRLEWFCGGHGPGETPGPFPNPEAKAWHGDGTAPDRVWESSTPPHHTYRKPLGAHAPRGFRIPETLTTQTHTPPQKHPGLLVLMRPTSGTIPGRPRRRGRRETARRVPISAGNPENSTLCFSKLASAL